jgi:hypothetical protein
MTMSLAELEDHPRINLIGGERYSLFRTNTGGTSLVFVYDLSTDTSRHQTADHLIIARADRLIEDSVTAVHLEHSDDDISYTTVFNDVAFASATLTGVRDEDYINTFTLTPAKRFWRVTLTASISSKFTMSKLVFGSFFDMQNDVHSYGSGVVVPSTPFIAPDGSQYFVNTDENTYEFDFRWRGIPDSQVFELERKLVDPQVLGHFLYTSGESNLLDEIGLLHCELVEHSFRKDYSDWNDVEMSFKEMKG